MKNKHIRVLKIGSSLLFLTGQLALAQDYTDLDCLVKPEMYINLSSPIDGVLAEVLVKKSEPVKKGQVLAKLEASVEAARVSVAQQEAQMDNLINAKQLRLAFIERKRDRLASLYKGKSVSTQEYDESVTEGDLAKSELVQAKQDKKKNELKLSLAQAELEQKIIKSPVDGIVVQNYLMPGESVENQPILQLAKIDPLMVEVIAPSTLFGKITKDMVVDIHPDAPANSQYKATVSVIDGIIDAASGSFSIRLALPNPDAALIGGTKCTARFAIKSEQNPLKAQAHSADDALSDDLKTLLSK